MSAINFGSFTTVNGRTTGLGFASGLNSSDLIDTILSAKQTNITDFEDTISVNSQRLDAVSTFKTLLSRFQTSADLLRAPTSVGEESSDLFKFTTTSLTSSTSTAASTFLSVTSESGATVTSYDVANIIKANSHQIQKTGFTSRTASVVANASVTDNYQASLGTVSGNVLNSSTPITFSNDVIGSKATINIEFGSQNQFESDDSLVIGSSDLRFGSGNGDADITVGTTVTDTVANIATYLNSVTTGDESDYTYTANGTTLIVTQKNYGTNDQIGTNLQLDADFSSGSDSTQTIKFGSDTAANNPATAFVNVEGTDGSQASIAKSATLDLVFGDQNQFDAADSIVFGNTTITFGGTGGDDIDISSATTLNDKIDAIVTRLNAVTTGPENTYTYSRSANGVLTATQDTTGTIASTGNDMTVTANFTTGTDNTTQTVAFGKNYENNGSSSGSVSPSNNAVSGSVSSNGIDGHSAASKATVSLKFTDNTFVGTDQLLIGASDLRFGGGGGDVDITVGASLPDTLVNIADYMNSVAGAEESGYTYTTDGVDSLIITRDIIGDNATIDNDMTIDADFNTVSLAIGSQATSNKPDAGNVNDLGTDGVNNTSVSDASTSHISSLSGAITLTGATFTAGSSTATSFTPNSVVFTATVGGETYTSKPIELDGGSVNGGGAGTNGIGNQIASGTELVFVKNSDTNSTQETTDVTFSLVVGDAVTIADETEADNYASSINTWLNTTNSITVTQNPSVPEFREGTFTLGGIEIALSEGDSLNVIKSKINAVSSTSGVTADIIQISDNNFSLVLKSANTGVDNKILEFGDGDAGDAPAGLLQFGLDNVAFTEVVAASDASFSLDGQTITRSSNNIDDVVEGLTFNLISDTPTTTPPTLTVNVNSDNDIIKTGVTDFLTAYNDLKFFIAEQTERDSDNNLVENAVLGDDAILRDILTQLDTQLSRTVSGLSSTTVNSLFTVGIDVFDFPGDETTPETNDVFILDESAFDAALASDFEALRNVFAFDFTANSSELSVFKHTNDLSITNFILDIDNTAASEFQVAVRDPNTNEILFHADLDEDSDTITGRSGTALEGTIFIYTGDGSDTITVSATTGIADTVFNLLDDYVKDDGLVDQFADSITDDNELLIERIATEQERIDIERERLIAEFALLESIIAQANNTLNFLNSQLESFNNN